jgi:hypothetical protein
MIVEIKRSPLEFKRYRVIMDNGKKIDFGYKFGKTYIDHHDKLIRRNYWKRHLANETEKRLIKNLVPSPALLSAMLLWGEHKTLKENAVELNRLWKEKHG